MVEAADEARAAATSELPSCRTAGHILVDAALPKVTSARPSARGWSKTASDLSEKMGTVGAGYIPKTDQTNCTANSKGLFAHYRVARPACADAHARRRRFGLGGITGIKDVSMIDAKKLTDIALGAPGAGRQSPNDATP